MAWRNAALVSLVGIYDSAEGSYCDGVRASREGKSSKTGGLPYNESVLFSSRHLVALTGQTYYKVGLLYILINVI